MTISRQSLCDLAYLRNQSLGGTPASVPYARYDALAPQAMAALARRVAADKDMADLLGKDFSLTVASGTAALTTFLTASEPLMLQFLQFAKITSADSNQPWQYLYDFTLLSLSRPTFGLIFYTIEGSSLQCTDTTGATGSLTTSATANASYIPLVASLSGIGDLEEMAVSILSQIATGQPDAVPTAA